MKDIVVGYGIGENFENRYPLLKENGIVVDYIADKRWEFYDDNAERNGIRIISFEKLRTLSSVEILFFPDSEIIADIVKDSFPNAKFTYASSLYKKLLSEKNITLEDVLARGKTIKKESQLDISGYIGEKIDSALISVVMQGPVNEKLTPEAIKSIRKFLPDSRIILSTWEGEKTDGLDVDEIIKSRDPGPIEMAGLRKYDNRNRQLVSTKEGLKAVNTEYCLKTRTDLFLLNNEFLGIFNSFPKRREEYKFFSYRLLSDRFDVLKVQAPEKAYVPMPMHVSDLFIFGYTCDLKKYFIDLPLATEKDFTDEYVKKGMYQEGYYLCPEQYFAIKAFETEFPQISIKDLMETTYKDQELSYQLIMNNFIILDENNLWIEFMKTYGMPGLNKNIKEAYSQDDFIRYYERL